ncbi:9356_t:CDS:2 [Ambispora leptoticha]|uniref:9356_t:CDS:1 n=1 Tax=Ambispora leptoticha TaxID=144679 RepID=A0A9N8ZUP2_9GLOM|nr:9356_t:CDS:2 [Ambispora leptoticha]
MTKHERELKSPNKSEEKIEGIPTKNDITYIDDNVTNLRTVTDEIPTSCRVVIFCEFCDRFTLFGIMAILQNYIQFPLPTAHSQQPGVMGKGENVATALTLFFIFITYSTLMIGAVIADAYWGKYKTIVVFGIIYALGPLILTATSIPPVLNTNAPFIGLIITILLIGLGRGGVKSNYTVAAAEQYPYKKPYLKTLKTGEKVIVDPELTIQSIFNLLYVVTNFGMLSPFITTTIEKYHSYWLAYLICFVFSVLSNLIFYLKNKDFKKIPPNGSILIDSLKVFRIALTGRARGLNSAKPSNMTPIQLNQYHVKWDDDFVDDLRKGLQACSLFLFIPIYWAAYSQSTTNMISQGATMRSGKMSNDLMTDIVPLAASLISIVVDKILYPTLLKCGVSLLQTTKIFIGFVCMALAMAYVAVLQWFIYKTGPCYQHTLCIIDGKMVPNDITALEYAYHKAPTSMESMVTALFFTTDGVGSALGLLVVPFSHDPYTFYVYIVMAALTSITGLLLIILFRKYDLKPSSLSGNS